jgi:pimeloyl-ACP methyl ester carboxylesterase
MLLGAVAAVVALLLGGPALGAGQAPSATSGATAATAVEPPPPRYSRTPCPTPNVPGVPVLELGRTFECGYLEVPQNRSAFDGTTIRVAVAIARAQNPAPDRTPLLYLAGGPGGTGLATAALRVADGWNADRDVIFVDQRGTLHAQPRLSCPEVDAFLHDAVHAAPTSASSVEASAAAARACRDRLADAGVDLAAYDTTENSADLADLRVALGIDQWNVYGVSYGTDLALQLVRDHPEGIRSLVLDSLVPPQVNLLEEFWPNAAAGYRALFDACAAQPACHAAYPDLEAEFVALVNELTLAPRTVTVPDPETGRDVEVVIDGYSLANLVVVASLAPGDIAPVPAIIHDLATGEGTKAALALLAGRPPSGLVGYGLAYGVFCREQAAFTSAAQVAARAKQALPTFPDAVLALVPQLPYPFTDCAAWTVPAAGAAVHQPATTDVPTLLLSGSLDAITPPRWADVAASTLGNVRHLIVPGAGHDVMVWAPACAVAMMRSFLADPGQADDRCLADLQVAPFDPPAPTPPSATGA